MKKIRKNNSLVLNKKSISTLNQKTILGGLAAGPKKGRTGDCSYPHASDCCTYVHFCTVPVRTEK